MTYTPKTYIIDDCNNQADYIPTPPALRDLAHEVDPAFAPDAPFGWFWLAQQRKLHGGYVVPAGLVERALSMLTKATPGVVFDQSQEVPDNVVIWRTCPANTTLTTPALPIATDEAARFLTPQEHWLAGQSAPKFPKKSSGPRVTAIITFTDGVQIRAQTYQTGAKAVDSLGQTARAKRMIAALRETNPPYHWVKTPDGVRLTRGCEVPAIAEIALTDGTQLYSRSTDAAKPPKAPAKKRSPKITSQAWEDMLARLMPTPDLTAQGLTVAAILAAAGITPANKGMSQ